MKYVFISKNIISTHDISTFCSITQAKNASGCFSWVYAFHTLSWGEMNVLEIIKAKFSLFIICLLFTFSITLLALQDARYTS